MYNPRILSCITASEFFCTYTSMWGCSFCYLMVGVRSCSTLPPYITVGHCLARGLRGDRGSKSTNYSVSLARLSLAPSPRAAEAAAAVDSTVPPIHLPPGSNVFYERVISVQLASSHPVYLISYNLFIYVCINRTCRTVRVVTIGIVPAGSSHAPYWLLRADFVPQNASGPTKNRT